MSIRFLFSDSEEEESVTLERKYPIRKNWFKQSFTEINEFSSYLNEIKQISEKPEGKIDNMIWYKVNSREY